MQNFRQAYRPPESAAEPQAAERMKEVELAKPWQRLLAGTHRPHFAYYAIGYVFIKD